MKRKNSPVEVEVVFAPTLPTDYGNRRSSAHDQAADQLRKRPHTWGLVRTNIATRSAAHGQASAIRKGGPAAYRPAGAFDARAITSEAGVHQVWVQYVGLPTKGGPRG